MSNSCFDRVLKLNVNKIKKKVLTVRKKQFRELFDLN